MSYAGHLDTTSISQSMLSVSHDQRKFENRACPVSSVQSVTETPCIRVSPEGTFSYTDVERHRTGTDSDTCPPTVGMGKRAFLKTKKWLKKPRTLQFPPVESPSCHDKPTASRREFRWTLQSSCRAYTARPSFHVAKRARGDSTASEMSSVSVVSTSSQSFASGEDSAEDVVLAILRPRPVLTLPLLDTGFSLQQTLINKRSTILLTPPSARPRNFDNIFIAPDSAPPFADTFRICSEDEKDADTSMQESWDGEWSREDMKEVQAKLRKLRTT